MEPHALTAPHTGHTTGTTHTTGAGHHFTTQTQEGTRTARTHRGDPMSHAYDAHSHTPAPAAAPRNGLGLTALVLGLVGVVCGLVPILFWASGTLGLIGFVLGLAGRSRACRSPRQAARCPPRPASSRAP